MPPRTRATASAAPAVAPLAVAPRRRLKITPLEKDTTTIKSQEGIDTSSKPITRSTRSKKETAAPTQTRVKKSTASTIRSENDSMTITSKSKPRSKKQNETTSTIEQEEDDMKSSGPLLTRPKRAVRSVRATATTVSSEAKGKPANRTTRTRSTKAVDKDEAEADVEVQKQPVVSIDIKPSKKKVTFQDTINDEKENQPMTRGTRKKVTTVKDTQSTKTSTGLRAKPVRKAATFATRGSKRTKADTSDDEDEKPSKKIQRVLTPKRINQVSLPESPEEPLSDELNNAKTPVKDLSKSPMRLALTQLSTVKVGHVTSARKLDMIQPALIANITSNTNMVSPARRPNMSPAKAFFEAQMPSPLRPILGGTSHPMESPARRPLDSPARILFPTASRPAALNGKISQSSNLFQSPKRSHILEAAQLFPRSSTKPAHTLLSRTNFLSSPPKRNALFSPPKQTLSTEEAMINASEVDDEMIFDEMQVTQLLAQPAEVNVTSYQRHSLSPVRPDRLKHEELQVDFDQSILPVGSPFKVPASPFKAAIVSPQVAGGEDAEIEQYNKGSVLESVAALSLANLRGDETIAVESPTLATPEPQTDLGHHTMNTAGQDEPSSAEDIMHEFVQTPRSTSLAQREQQSSSNIHGQAIQYPVYSSPDILHANQLTVMANAFTPTSTRHGPTIACNDIEAVLNNQIEEPASNSSLSTPKKDSIANILNEHELTGIGKRHLRQQKSISSPTSIYEHELTVYGEEMAIDEAVDLSGAVLTPNPVQTPEALEQHELTIMAQSFTPRVATDIPRTEFEFEISLSSSASHDAPSSSKNQSTMQDITENVPTTINQVSTPVMPKPRKFNLHTVVSKVPLRAEGSDSPVKLNISKRKRPQSLGGQCSTELDHDVFRAKFVAPTKEDNSSEEVAIHTPQVAVATTPVSSKSAAKKSKKFSTTPSTRTPLAEVISTQVLNDVVVYIDVRTSEGVDAGALYHDLLKNLGATVVKEWKDNLTHIVFKDGNSRILERVRLSGADIKVVGVAWPLDCEEKQSWIDEAEYMLVHSETDHQLGSVSRSTRRKSMQPSTLISDGSGIVKRSRSRTRASTGGRLRSIKLPDLSSSSDNQEVIINQVTTPRQDPITKQKEIEKNSLTTAWKSINAVQNLGEDTPARKTLELLQKSYTMEHDWDSSALEASFADNEKENNLADTPRHSYDEDDTEIIETGLTPAPYRVAPQVGSAPAKANNTNISSYRERVEEMERRKMRDNAFGTNKGTRGKNGKRMTMFGAGLKFEPVRGSPLRD